jgi:hypothetical protein
LDQYATAQGDPEVDSNWMIAPPWPKWSHASVTM